MKKISLALVLLLTGIILISGVSGCASQNKSSMPIVLLTDYGSEDYRISQLKGIIYSNNADARVIDATHSVPAFDIPTGAFILDVSAKEFPEKVVFIAIVAPYAQPVIRYLVLTSNKNQIFILPDNGLLTYIVKDVGINTVYEINNQALFGKPLKDLVAERIQGKIGALIASGYPAKNVGSPATSITTLDVQEPVIENNRLLGTIVYIDHYGNAVTNISAKTVSQFGVRPGEILQVKGLGNSIPIKFGTIYSDVPQNEEIMFVVNNLDVLQMSINLGSFAGAHGAKAGMKIEIDKTSE